MTTLFTFSYYCQVGCRDHLGSLWEHKISASHLFPALIPVTVFFTRGSLFWRWKSDCLKMPRALVSHSSALCPFLDCRRPLLTLPSSPWQTDWKITGTVCDVQLAAFITKEEAGYILLKIDCFGGSSPYWWLPCPWDNSAGGKLQTSGWIRARDNHTMWSG